MKVAVSEAGLENGEEVNIEWGVWQMMCDQVCAYKRV